MNKKSDVDILIEQCIQDAKNEYLEEGFVDKVKAGFSGAKEWLKADARNSFKFRNKNDIKNDRRWSARKGKVSSYAKSIANTLQDYKKSGGTLGRGMKVDDVISRLNQVAQGKYPRGEAQNSSQTQPTQEQPQQPQQVQQTQQPQQKPSIQNQKQEANNQKQQVSGQKPTQPSNNTVGQNKMLNSIGGNVPQENTPNKAESSNNGYSAEANELINSFGSFRSKDTDIVDKLQGIYNNLNDDEKEKIKQQVNPDIINLINLQQNNAPWEQLNQAYGSLSPQDRGIFRVITGTKHSSQTKQEIKSEQPTPEQPTPEQSEPQQSEPQQSEPQQSEPEQPTPEQPAAEQSTPEQSVPQENNKQQPSKTGNTPEAKGPSFKEKGSNALPTGDKKVKNSKIVKPEIVKSPPTPQSQAAKQPNKKVLSQSEKAKKAKAKARKLNVPNAGKPIKRRRIINAKQRKDIAATSKQMEDYHKSLGDTGAEWEERIHESYYGSNTRGQLSMLNSIR